MCLIWNNCCVLFSTLIEKYYVNQQCTGPDLEPLMVNMFDVSTVAPITMFCPEIRTYFRALRSALIHTKDNLIWVFNFYPCQYMSLQCVYRMIAYLKPSNMHWMDETARMCRLQIWDGPRQFWISSSYQRLGTTLICFWFQYPTDGWLHIHWLAEIYPYP